MMAKETLALVDDASGVSWNYVMRTKDETKNILIKFIKWLDRVRPKALQRLRADNGTEFINKDVKSICADRGITLQCSNAYSQSENGSVERNHQTLFARVRCAVLASGMETRFWPYAYVYLGMVENHIPKQKHEWKTNYEVFTKEKSNLSDIQPWGAICWANIPRENRSDKDLGPRALKCKFLGLSETHKAYVLHDLHYNRIIESRDVVFDRTDRARIAARSFPVEREPVTEAELQNISRIGDEVTTDTNSPSPESVGVQHKPTSALSVDSRPPTTEQTVLHQPRVHWGQPADVDPTGSLIPPDPPTRGNEQNTTSSDYTT